MKIVTIFSGGMDSTTLLYQALSEGAEVHALSFNYGQKHKKELEKAKELCPELGVIHHVVDISSVKSLLVSALTSNAEVPEGHYAEDNMKQTVVPNRNAIMLSIAYGYAVSIKADKLYFGAHSGDHFVYPDCRPEFAGALNTALRIGNEGFADVSLLAPFNEMSKTDIARRGFELKVPFEKTWSCYRGEERPCLKCGTCVERTEAFLDNDKQDPLLTDNEWQDAVNYLNNVKEGLKK